MAPYSLSLSLSLSRRDIPQSALNERLDELIAWHTIYYSVNKYHPLDITYVDNHFYYCDILPHFNPPTYQAAFSDKNYYDVIFSHFPTPHTLVKRIKGHFYKITSHYSHESITLESVVTLMKHYERVLIKPTLMRDTGRGSGIEIINTDLNFSEILHLLQSRMGDFTIQEVITQHSFLADLQPRSVNTFRIMTFLYKGEIRLLSAFLAIGSGGSISNGDNSNRIGINENGILRDFLVKDGFILDNNGLAPDDDTKAESVFGVKVPHFKKVVDMAKNMHLVLPHFGLIGWDFTIDENGEPVMIELNIDCPGGELPQFCNAPLFGTQSEEIFIASAKSAVLESIW